MGAQQIIRPGEVNWMTAGSGIAHSERFEDPAALAGGAAGDDTDLGRFAGEGRRSRTFFQQL